MRGGGYRGGGGGKLGNRGKRQATTPVGGIYKDSRRNIQGDEEYDDEEEWTQVIYSKPKSPSNQPQNGNPALLPTQAPTPSSTMSSQQSTQISRDVQPEQRRSFVDTVASGIQAGRRSQQEDRGGAVRSVRSVQTNSADNAEIS